MNPLSRLFGAKYDDEKLTTLATNAITEDPLLSDITGVVISSQNGILQLSGMVHKVTEKERIEDDITHALSLTGLKHDRIVNAINVN